MAKIEYIEGNEKDLDLVGPLWEKLNEHHKRISRYFSNRFSQFTFSERKDRLLEKAKSGALRLDLAKDVDLNRYVGYCVSTISEDKEGEIESIYVEADYSGLGIGDRLMKKALEWMDNQAVKTKKTVVASGNEEVFKFYSRYGFFPRSITLGQLSNMKEFQVRPLNKGDHDWAARFLEEQWGSTKIVTRGRIHRAEELPGFIAVQEDRPVGLVTYRIDGDECEIVTMNSLVEGVGIGSALLDAVKGVAASANCKRLWLITTNDNVAALSFYQKMGFSLVTVHRNALEQSRRLKPEIPLVGMDGIPLRDEIELELIL